MVCRARRSRSVVLGVVAVVVLGAGVVAPAPATASIRLVPILSGLDRPVFVTHARDGSHRLFIVEQPGVIKVFTPGGTSATVFLDISPRVLSGGERGLLGLTFHPAFASNRRFFVNYTRQGDGATVVAEYRASPGDPAVADTAETVLLVIPQPFANHNGGMVEFGPDGFLYVAVGDGGGGNDPGNRAQDRSQLLGSILRIDVDRVSGTRPYASPPDNPFIGMPNVRDEIYAYGLRNPFRFSFDRATGELYAGDVGQSALEEIDIITAGGNYGWRVWEGTRCTPNDPGLCDPATVVFPIAEYAHTGGRCAVIGGYVYRGTEASVPPGTYVYGDLCTGEVFLLRDGVSSLALRTGLSLSSFGEDESGELYVVDLGGTIRRIESACGPGETRPATCPALSVVASVNGASFTQGQTITATVAATNPGLPGTADFYVGVLLPDDTIRLFVSPDTVVIGIATDPASLSPIAAAVALAEPFSVTVPDFFAYRWTGTEPPGEYTLFVLVVQAGALADASLTPSEILALATAPFRFP